MVMTGTLFLLHHGGGTISPSEAVCKSYPDFFNLIFPEKEECRH
jgi:5-enolpyruvylshikimate-3-phosphate synthase